MIKTPVLRSCVPVHQSRHFIHLKCLYTNAHSIRNKQNELEALVCSQSYDGIGVGAMWWDESHRLLRRGRQGRWGGGVALCVRERFGCTVLTVRNCVLESFWVRNSGDSKQSKCYTGCLLLVAQAE